MNEKVIIETSHGPVSLEQLLKMHDEWCSGDLFRICRCKDCKHYVETQDDDYSGGPTGVCTYNPDDVENTHKHAWCFKGERKDIYGDRT